jgi:hypothetical protein
LNYGEVQAAESRADFIHKMKVILKELRETRICLKIIIKKPLLEKPSEIEPDLKECSELISIFSTSIKTSEKNNEIASKAVKSAERNNAIALFVQLQNMYQSDDSFRSTKLVWEIYKKYQSNADGTPISSHDALKFVQDTDRASAEWNAVHIVSTFWRHLALLTRLKYMDEEIVFEAFTSPRILGFLHPVEKAFLDFENQTYDYERSLKWLYNRWQEQGRTGAED